MPMTRRGRAPAPAKPAIIPACVRAGDRADDDRVEEDAELALLLLDLVRPAGEAEPAERMVGRAGRDRVRRAAARLDVGERLLPALLEADAEARRAPAARRRP